MSNSEYEKKRDEAFRNSELQEQLRVSSHYFAFVKGSDFGREYQRCEVECLKKQLEIAIKGLEKIGNYFCACSVDYEIVPQVEATQTLKQIQIKGCKAMSDEKGKEYWVHKGTSNFCNELIMTGDYETMVKQKPDDFYDIVSTADTVQGGIHVIEKSAYDQLTKELEWYKEKFELAANSANESRQAYNKLMKDARALQAALDLIMEVDNTYDSKTWDIADKASADFDKKYPQLNEKE